MGPARAVLAGLLSSLAAVAAAAVEPCRLDIVERGSGWPVPLVELRTLHGVRFVSDNAGVIALDLPDPIGPATELYEEAFFRDCKRALAAGGVLSLHMGSPVSRPERVRTHYERLTRVFSIVRPYTMFIPLYGCLWSMAACSDTLDAAAIGAEEIEQIGRAHV